MENGDNREQRQIFKVYTVVEKPGSQKGIWLDIGVASHNRDGSMSAKLDALPVNGTIQIREYEPRRGESTRQNGEKKPHGEWQ